MDRGGIRRRHRGELPSAYRLDRSPDGRWLAYGRGPGAHDPEFPGFTTDPVIWLVRPDGSGFRPTAIAGLPSSRRTQP